MNPRGLPPRLPAPRRYRQVGHRSRNAPEAPQFPRSQPHIQASFMLAIIGGSGLTRLSTLAVAHREVVRTPVWRAVVRAALRPDRGPRYGLPRPAWPRAHDSAAPRQLSRKSLGAEGRAARQPCWPSLPSAASAASSPGELVLPHQLIDYTHDREGTFFDGGDQQRRACRFHRIRTPRRCARVPRRGAQRPASRSPTAASMARCRGHASRPPPRSTASTATARRCVGMTGMPEAVARARARASVRRDRGRREPRCGPRRLRTRGFDGRHRARARDRDG